MAHDIEIYEKDDGSYRYIYLERDDNDIRPHVFKARYKSQVDALVAEGRAILKPYSEYVPTWRENRKDNYGTILEQLEYIVENGIDAFITKQNTVKTNFPKT